MSEPPLPSRALLEALVRVRHLLRSPPGEARIAPRELRRTLQALVALFDALRPYLKHSEECGIHTLSETPMYGRRWPGPCTCGLSNLVDERAVLVTLRPNETWAERRERVARRNG